MRTHPVYANLIPVEMAVNAKQSPYVTSVPTLIYNNTKPNTEFAISQFEPLDHAIMSFEITGRHMQVQPLSWFLSDGAVWIVYFNSEGEMSKYYQIVVPSKLDMEQDTPVYINGYQRLHVQHIQQPENAISRTIYFMDNKLDVEQYPSTNMQSY
jgi:hypothetical protein